MGFVITFTAKFRYVRGNRVGLRSSEPSRSLGEWRSSQNFATMLSRLTWTLAGLSCHRRDDLLLLDYRPNVRRKACFVITAAGPV